MSSIPDNGPAAALERENRAIVDSLRQLRSGLRGVDRRAAIESLQRVEAALHAHFDWEEDVVFPTVLMLTRNASSETVRSLLSEHDSARGMLDRIARRLGDVREQPPMELIDELLQLMGFHQLREEQLVYPLLREHCRTTT